MKKTIDPVIPKIASAVFFLTCIVLTVSLLKSQNRVLELEMEKTQMQFQYDSLDHYLFLNEIYEDIDEKLESGRKHKSYKNRRVQDQL